MYVNGGGTKLNSSKSSRLLGVVKWHPSHIIILHSTKKIWLADWNLKFPVTNGTAFLKFPKNMTTSQSACIPKFSEMCYREFLFHSNFVSLAEWFKFQKFGNLLDFPGHSPRMLSILLPFCDFRNFWLNGKYPSSKISPLCVHLSLCFAVVVGIHYMWSWMRSICCASSKRALLLQTCLLWKSKSVSLRVFMCTFW